MKDEQLKQVLLKKAMGYDTDEVVEEYSYSDGEETLLKRKVTRKNVPPDIQAMKMLQDDSDTPLETLTDEQLKKEKERLLKLLSKN